MDTTKFSHSLFYSKFRKTCCMLTKCIAMNPKNHSVNKFWLLFFVFVILKVIDQIPSWKEMKEAFSVKLQTEKLCFCLSKTQAAQIKNENVVFSNTFIRMWGLIWTNDWENTAYWEESEQREVLANKFGLS